MKGVVDFCSGSSKQELLIGGPATVKKAERGGRVEYLTSEPAFKVYLSKAAKPGLLAESSVARIRFWVGFWRANAHLYVPTGSSI